MVKNAVTTVKLLFVPLIDSRSVSFWKKNKKVSINVHWNAPGCLEKADYPHKIRNTSLYNENRTTIEISWVPAGERGSVVWRLRAGPGAGWSWCLGTGWCKVSWMQARRNRRTGPLPASSSSPLRRACKTGRARWGRKLLHVFPESTGSHHSNISLRSTQSVILQIVMNRGLRSYS